MEIRLTPSAKDDLGAIEDYIAADNPDAAVGVVLRVLAAIEGLAELPNIGRPGRVHGTRELVVSGTPFVAVYRVRANVISVVRVLHAARLWPD